MFYSNNIRVVFIQFHKVRIRKKKKKKKNPIFIAFKSNILTYICLSINGIQIIITKSPTKIIYA